MGVPRVSWPAIDKNRIKWSKCVGHFHACIIHLCRCGMGHRSCIILPRPSGSVSVSVIRVSYKLVGAIIASATDNGLPPSQFAINGALARGLRRMSTVNCFSEPRASIRGSEDPTVHGSDPQGGDSERTSPQLSRYIWLNCGTTRERVKPLRLDCFRAMGVDIASTDWQSEESFEMC